MLLDVAHVVFKFRIAFETVIFQCFYFDQVSRAQVIRCALSCWVIFAARFNGTFVSVDFPPNTINAIALELQVHLETADSFEFPLAIVAIKNWIICIVIMQSLMNLRVSIFVSFKQIRLCKPSTTSRAVGMENFKMFLIK